MSRVAAIILKENSLALIERKRAGLTYYVFPGGQIEDGESQVEALMREIKEELGLEINAGRLVAEVVFQGASQFFYLAEIVGGEFGAGRGEEMLGLVAVERGTYTPVWSPLAALLQRDVRPRAIAELVIRAQASGWLQDCLLIRESG